MNYQELSEVINDDLLQSIYWDLERGTFNRARERIFDALSVLPEEDSPTLSDEKLQELSLSYWREIEAVGMAYEFTAQTISQGSFVAGYRSALSELNELRKDSERLGILLHELHGMKWSDTPFTNLRPDGCEDEKYVDPSTILRGLDAVRAAIDQNKTT